MNSNLFSAFEDAIRKQHGRALQSAAILPADSTDTRAWSWADVLGASGRIANLLASLKLPAGSRVAVQVDKSVENLMLYLAVLRAGHVYLPLNTAYQAAEMDYFIGDAQPAVLVCANSTLATLAPIAQRHGVAHVFTLDAAPNLAAPHSLLAAAGRQVDAFVTVQRAASDLACILYTSGTTGRSKGAMLTHGNMLSNAQTLHRFWGFSHKDVLLHALPIFHVHGLFVACHAALLAGARMIWCNKFDAAQAVKLLPQASVFMGVPTMYVRLLAQGELTRKQCKSMRLFISGSAPLLAETHRQFAQATGHMILERYGMSETIMLTSNPYHPKAAGQAADRRAGTVGPALPGVQLRIMGDGGKPCAAGEIGGIEVKGPNVFAGYWKMPEKTAAEFTPDGFFKTGDVGKLSGDGYVTIVGRSKDLIITGGYNVYPKEIEGWLDDQPGVDESAVIGVPHPDFGEAVCAVVVPKAGAQVDGDALIARLKGEIAAFKVPKRIWVLAELPRNTMGKVQKNVLRETYAGTFK
ncbi:MAG TPA: malonyl-CoA synthase [Burkholderiaceae bacterium]|nr:malonyl-CoA synthase [Burkholderiaceae bacterium]